MEKFWKWPWGLAQNSVLLSALVINSFIIQYLNQGRGVAILPFPYNAIALFCFLSFFTILYYLPFTSRMRAWIVSYPLVITCLSSLGILSLVSGFFPQGTALMLPPVLKRLGLQDITTSYAFTLLSSLLALSLLYAVLKRAKKFKMSDLAFYLNHLGLLIIILAHGFGSSDRQMVKLDLELDQVAWMGRTDEAGKKLIEMPFALKLKKFSMEEYAPELAYIDGKTMKVLKTCPMIEKTSVASYRCDYQGHQLSLDSFMSNAFEVGGKYVEVNHLGTAPVAQVKIQAPGLVGNYGPVTSGSQFFAPRFVTINPTLSIAMLPAKAKSYASNLQYYTPEGEIGELSISVNKPKVLKGWKLYQYGYDDTMGKWSKLSIIEAVRDPWLPYVYLGIFLLLLGSLWMLVVALPKKSKELSNDGTL